MMPRSGPHLAMAFLCEKVLEEKDSALSFIRVVDRVMNRSTTRIA